MMIRKRRTTTTNSRPTKRRQITARRYIVPTYRGWNARSFQKGEWKYRDYGQLNNVSYTGSMNCLNSIGEGTGATQRVGRQVTLRSLELRLEYFATPSTGMDQRYKIFIVLDKQANGVIPDFTDIYDTWSYTSVGDPLSSRKLENRSRFKIVKEIFGRVNAPGHSPDGVARKIFIRFKRPVVTTYNAPDATTAAIQVNSLWLGVINNQSSTSAGGTLSFNSRLRYTDV